MKALTLTQPWATLVAIRAKLIETRGWPTSYRGPVAIHAAKGMPQEAIELCHEEPFQSVLKAAGMTCAGDLPRGVIVAAADLTDCRRFDDRSVKAPDCIVVGGRQMPAAPNERAFGDFTPGRYGFALGDAVGLEPIECRGALGLWFVPADVAHAIDAARLATKGA